MKSRPIRIGLTGGIGSGKSTVLHRIAEQGVPVESADAIVHRLYARPGAATRAVARLLGDDALAPDGSVNRAVVRAQTFVDANDPRDVQAMKDTRRLQLMAVLDPFIWNGFLAHERQQAAAPLVVWEIPLLVEVNWTERVDAITVVDCPEEVQRSRVKTRNGWTDSIIDEIIARQASRQARLDVANDVLHGDAPRATLIGQVDHLVKTWHQRYAAETR